MGLTVEFNFIAVIIAGLIYFALGALWYSPYLFSKQWLEEMDKTPDELRTDPKMYVIPLVAMLFSSFVLVHFIKFAEANNAIVGMITAFWVWIGFILTTAGTTAFFAGKSLRLFMIDNGYHLAGFLLMGMILGQFA